MHRRMLCVTCRTIRPAYIPLPYGPFRTLGGDRRRGFRMDPEPTGDLKQFVDGGPGLLRRLRDAAYLP